MDLSVVIVSYNAVGFLRLCLNSVFEACKNINAEVYVVDNNSADHVVEVVKNEFPECLLIANKNNPGFAIANNQAIRQCKGKYVLVLNPDTVVAEDTFEKAIRFMEDHNDAGGLGIKMIDGSGLFLPESKRGIPSPWVSFCKMSGLSSIFPSAKIFSEYHKGYLAPDKNHAVEVLSGAFMCLRKSVLDQVGLLDEDFFMYGEDIDLSYRIIKGGFQNYYFSESTIIHFKGESTSKDKKYRDRFYKAMIQFAEKHFSKSYGAVLSLFIITGITLAKFIAFVIRGFIKNHQKEPEIKVGQLIFLEDYLPIDKYGKLAKESHISLSVKDLSQQSGGTIVFPINKISYKEMIQIMSKYRSQFRYRFFDEQDHIVIGSDKKDAKGVICLL